MEAQDPLMASLAQLPIDLRMGRIAYALADSKASIEDNYRNLYNWCLVSHEHYDWWSDQRLARNFAKRLAAIKEHSILKTLMVSRMPGALFYARELVTSGDTALCKEAQRLYSDAVAHELDAPHALFLINAGVDPNNFLYNGNGLFALPYTTILSEVPLANEYKQHRWLSKGVLQSPHACIEYFMYRSLTPDNRPATERIINFKNITPLFFAFLTREKAFFTQLLTHPSVRPEVASFSVNSTPYLMGKCIIDAQATDYLTLLAQLRPEYILTSSNVEHALDNTFYTGARTLLAFMQRNNSHALTDMLYESLRANTGKNYHLFFEGEGAHINDLTSSGHTPLVRLIEERTGHADILSVVDHPQLDIMAHHQGADALVAAATTRREWLTQALKKRGVTPDDYTSKGQRVFDDFKHNGRAANLLRKVYRMGFNVVSNVPRIVRSEENTSDTHRGTKRKHI